MRSDFGRLFVAVACALLPLTADAARVQRPLRPRTPSHRPSNTESPAAMQDRTSPHPQDAEPSDFDPARWVREVRSTRYLPPDDAWLDAFGTLVGNADRTSDRSSGRNPDRKIDRDALARWQTLGFETRRRGDVLWVRETAPPSGKGAYALRTGGTRALLLQAPHGDTDMGTRDIALSLFDETGALALAINSARRDAAPEADQAHSPRGPFARMATTLAAAHPGLLTVQVHGFSARTAEALEVSPDTVIVGGGSAIDNAEFAACLRTHGFAAMATNERTRRLAGQTNAVRSALRRDGSPRFVHLEFGPDERNRLLREPAARKALARCL